MNQGLFLIRSKMIALPCCKVLTVWTHSHTDCDRMILALRDDLHNALLHIVQTLQLYEPCQELLLLREHLQHGHIVLSCHITSQADGAVVETVQDWTLASLQPEKGGMTKESVLITCVPVIEGGD